MTEHIGEFVNQRKQRFDWMAVLPHRTAWLQTLILLPFGLPVANFLATSWNFAINAIVKEQQYPIAAISMAFNLILPSIFFAFLLHWVWFVWKEESPNWYPHRRSLWAGVYATLTIAASFAIVELFNQSFGVCGNGGWGDIAENLLCNLNGYGFESKSWFGVWFIIAAYCNQAQGLITLIYRHYSPAISVNDAKSTASTAANGELEPDDSGSNPLDSIHPSAEE
jgi:hypothetical protein